MLESLSLGRHLLRLLLVHNLLVVAKQLIKKSLLLAHQQSQIAKCHTICIHNRVVLRDPRIVHILLVSLRVIHLPLRPIERASPFPKALSMIGSSHSLPGPFLSTLRWLLRSSSQGTASSDSLVAARLSLPGDLTLAATANIADSKLRL